MPVTPFDAASIAAACAPRLADLTNSLERCFEGIGVLEPGESRAWETPPEAFFGAGIVIRIETSGGTILGLLPASFPLPEWHLEPNEAEQARLATLALEWGEHLAPAEVAIERTRAEPIDDLIASVTPVANDSSCLVSLNPEGCEGDTLRTIYVLACPARKEGAPKPAPTTRPDSPPHATESPKPMAPTKSWREPSPDDPRRARLNRVLNVPVQVAVRLAEKRIELDQLLTLGPGSLISFDKNCEDLLDLYVNNRLFGRGEAVKIGEHFGLKIDEVGSVKRREERVF
ncbi:MAG: FliM/FliN family flagellar motor switch protein [Planctomycetota bacterium]|nr:FliM/FliN family flagellar motor switch protein [Planctomycetota bacterium]